jgi:hypothetical protein
MIRINGVSQIIQDEVGEIKRPKRGSGTTRHIVTAACNKFLIEHGCDAIEFGFNNFKPYRKKKCKPSNGVENYEFESDVFP